MEKTTVIKKTLDIDEGYEVFDWIEENFNREFDYEFKCYVDMFKFAENLKNGFIKKFSKDKKRFFDIEIKNLNCPEEFFENKNLIISFFRKDFNCFTFLNKANVFSYDHFYEEATGKDLSNESDFVKWRFKNEPEELFIDTDIDKFIYAFDEEEQTVLIPEYIQW